MLGDEKIRQLREENDLVSQMGQEDEKKAKPVIEKVMKEQDKLDEVETGENLQKIRKASYSPIKTYNTLLAELLVKRMNFVDFPQGWHWEVSPTKEGVVMEMKSPDGRYFRSAFKPTGKEIYDLNAINTYGIRAENTIDRIEKEKEPIAKSLPREN
jgi:hypothetical protein